MTSENKPTPGAWFTNRDGFSTVYVEARICGGWLQEVAACGPTEQGPEQQESNARLIAEAGTVFHECGLSPRELLDKNQDYKAQNARLTVALRNLCKHFPTDADMAELGWEVEYVETACQAYDTARAVLAKQKE